MSMRLFRSVVVAIDAIPALARCAPDYTQWESYHFERGEWTPNYRIQGRVIHSGDWETCTEADHRAAVAIYEGLKRPIIRP